MVYTCMHRKINWKSVFWSVLSLDIGLGIASAQLICSGLCCFPIHFWLRLISAAFLKERPPICALATHTGQKIQSTKCRKITENPRIHS